MNVYLISKVADHLPLITDILRRYNKDSINILGPNFDELKAIAIYSDKHLTYCAVKYPINLIPRQAKRALGY